MTGRDLNGTGAAFAAAFVLIFSIIAAAQPAASQTATPPAAVPSKRPEITQVDAAALRALLKPKDKPLLVNFWATWCEPCREEFPDLVKIDHEFRGKIDFITVSLDDVEELNRAVPKFLADMKAEMPAYLLKAGSEAMVIDMVSKDWPGGLPFTVLYDTRGRIAYSRQGKIRHDTLKEKIEKLFLPPVEEPVAVMEFIKIKEGRRAEALFYYEQNWRLYRDAALAEGHIASYELIDTKAPESAPYHLILITRYKSEDQRFDAEKNFDPIIKRIRPNGPMLKNALKPDDFRESVSTATGTIVLPKPAAPQPSTGN